MELTFLMKIRIAAVFAVGIIILGFGGFPFVAPDTPLDAISLFMGNISVLDAVICALLAFITGIVAYFVAYPYGKQIGPVAVAGGLAAWTFRSGLMASILQVNNTVDLRREIYTKAQFESILWLAVIAAGFVGTFAASKFSNLKEAKTPDPLTPQSGKNQGINIAIAMVLTVVISYFAVGIFAQDVKLFDSQLTSVIGQPGNGQIAFAVIVSFGLAAFVAKYFLSVSYIYVSISAVLLVFWSVRVNAIPTLEHMTRVWPAHIFPESITAILPLQMVSFAVIGSIAGYWFAIHWAYSRKTGEQGEKASANTDSR